MKIAILGDFHYPLMQDGEQDLLTARDVFFGAMLQKFLEVDADLHISLGDLTNEGHSWELQRILEDVRSFGEGRRFIHVLGNHDTYTMPKRDILALTGQKRYHAIEMEEADLLFLDTTKEMDPDDWGGELDGEQLVWLEERIARSGGKPLWVFGHHPVYDTTARSLLDKLSIHPRHELKALLNRKQGPGVYFCGHNHQQSIVRDGSWHYVQTAAALDVPGFRIAELQEDGFLRIGMLRVEDEELLRLSRFIGMNMLHYRPLAGAEGKEADQMLEAGRQIAG